MDFVTIARDVAQGSWENSLAHPFIQKSHQGILSESCLRGHHTLCIRVGLKPVLHQKVWQLLLKKKNY